jgi:hypothetical protein
MIFLSSTVNTRDVCTRYLCISFCTINMSCSEQNIPPSHDLATKLSWPEISREVATAFPFEKINNYIILFLTLLFQDLPCCITFLSLSRVYVCACVRACVRASALCDYVWLCACGKRIYRHLLYILRILLSEYCQINVGIYRRPRVNMWY